MALREASAYSGSQEVPHQGPLTPDVRRAQSCAMGRPSGQDQGCGSKSWGPSGGDEAVQVGGAQYRRPWSTVLAAGQAPFLCVAESVTGAVNSVLTIC